MSNPKAGKPVEILLVEDNPADVRLTIEGLKQAKIANNLHTVSNGDAALSFLRKEGEFADSPRPDIVFLDLNMPGKDGREVLKEVKADEDLKVIPIVVLTSSEAEADVVGSYEKHANCFISKPVDFEGFVKVIQSLESFWFKVVVLP